MKMGFGRIDGFYATELPDGDEFWSHRRVLCARTSLGRRVFGRIDGVYETELPDGEEF
jgi:hypothetical protein